MAQGITQQEGIDFTDTFSATAKLTAVRIIAAIAVQNDWELDQMDVNAAYLNASFKEDIYMHQLKGFEEPGQEDKVTHLKPAIMASGNQDVSGMQIWCTLSPALASNNAEWNMLSFTDSMKMWQS